MATSPALLYTCPVEVHQFSGSYTLFVHREQRDQVGRAMGLGHKGLGHKCLGRVRRKEREKEALTRRPLEGVEGVEFSLSKQP